MGEIIKFHSDNPHSWTVQEALEMALETVKNGKFDADKCYIALCNSEDSDTGCNIYYTMAGMQVPEAIGWLFLHMNILMSDGG